MSYWDGTRWLADEPTATSPPSRKRRFLGAVAEAGLITALVFGLIATSAFAAKGGNGGNNSTHTGGGHKSSSDSTLSVVMVIDVDGSGTPNWDDTVTFDVSTTATDKPWVRLDCYQGGTWVSTATAGFFDAYPWAPNFTLSSGSWTGGAADCSATLYKVTSNGRTKTLATLTFNVGA